MTNLAGIAPIEQTKALTHIMHYSIQVNFYAQTSAQFELIKISSMTSQADDWMFKARAQINSHQFHGCTVFPAMVPFEWSQKEW